MRRNRRRVDVHLDIAPVNLIDLLLVLLIFFVTTTSFLQLKVIELVLPAASSTTQSYEKAHTYVVNIDRDCRVFVDAKPVSLAVLGEQLNALKAGDEKALFQLGADEASPHRCFIDVLDTMKENGIENIAVQTRMREE